MEYEGDSKGILERLLKLDGTLSIIIEKALLAPVDVYEKFRKLVLLSKQLGENIREWNFDLQIGDNIEPMKLVWIRNFYQFISSFDITIPGYVEPDIYNPNIKKAFSFLQPGFLQYMDKPFNNPDAITQVLLLLEYHRNQKRDHNIEIFNIFDLIAFKMAIDDNRYEYENCEFHKLIVKNLTDLKKHRQYIRDDTFYVNDYISDKWMGNPPNEFLDYLVYHFQHTIGYFSWKLFDPLAVKISDIMNIPKFLEYLAEQSEHVMQITETDSNGNCAAILYDIMAKAKIPVKFEFKLEGEWHYIGNAELLNYKPDTLCAFEFTINTKNKLKFVENFISWLKFAFGERCNLMKLMIHNFDDMSPYVFNGFHIGALTLFFVTLDAKLVRTLQNCKYGTLTFWRCRIANDINETIELMGHRLKNGQNIFKYFNELENVKYINLLLEDHTIGILWAYIASVMVESQLQTFKFRNCIQLVGQKLIYLNDLTFCLNKSRNQINVFTLEGARFNFYEFLNSLEPNDGEEFNLWELYDSYDEYDFYQQLDGAKLYDKDQYDFYN